MELQNDVTKELFIVVKKNSTKSLTQIPMRKLFWKSLTHQG